MRRSRRHEEVSQYTGIKVGTYVSDSSNMGWCTISCSYVNYMFRIESCFSLAAVKFNFIEYIMNSEPPSKKAMRKGTL
jgi:hypothetical protein